MSDLIIIREYFRFIEISTKSIKSAGVSFRYLYNSGFDGAPANTKKPINAIAHCGTKQRSDVDFDGTFELRKIFLRTLQSKQLDTVCELGPYIQ